jgi:ABC-type sugar transport system ATPase subunit
MVEIAKALYRNPRVLILDEPTSSLSAHEAGILAELVFRLRDRGVSILYISHRLNEVRAICSHVTVLKDGVVMADQSLSGMDAAGLVRLMVGRDAGDLFPPRMARPIGETRIEVRGFSSGMVRDVDFTARAGEIVGIGGLVGQGQEDFLLGLYGAVPVTAASAAICGSKRPFTSVGEANAAGLAYVPADRKREGLVLPHSIAANLLLPSMGTLLRHGLRDSGRERDRVAALSQQLGIKGDTKRAVQALSGGNQQKVALAKWLPLSPVVLLLNDPTRGVDIQTKREIYLLLKGFAEEGKLLILLSSDTPELVHLADRVMVFHEGRIGAVLEGADISEEAIVGAAMGVSARGIAA